MLAGADAATAKEEEEVILERVREALGARHVIRVCASSDQSQVLSAAKRLLDNAEEIHAAGINLAGELVAAL